MKQRRKYRHLDQKTEYYPFAARVGLRRRQRRTAHGLRVLALLCLVGAAALLARQYLFHGGQPTSAELGPSQSLVPSVSAESAGSTAETSAVEAPVLERYRRLYARNPDLIGWLEVEGTAIDYPVMQTPGDNEYYLRRGFDGLYSVGGSLFMDEHCSVTRPTSNLVIYGHNMMDGSMFGALAAYADPAFGAAHNMIRFDSLRRSGVWELVAVVQTDTQSEYPYYHFFDAPDRDTWNAFCANIAAHALYDTGVTVDWGDELLTLSTCASWLDSSERLGLIARRVSG